MLTCMEVANYLLSKTDEEAGDVISNLKLQNRGRHLRLATWSGCA